MYKQAKRYILSHKYFILFYHIYFLNYFLCVVHAGVHAGTCRYMHGYMQVHARVHAGTCRRYMQVHAGTYSTQ